MVVNAIIVAMAKHGTAVRKPEDLNVYHVVPCGKNPLTIGELFNFSFEHFSSSPMISVRGEKIDITRVKFLSPKEDPSPYILEAYFKLNGLTNATTSDEVLPSRRLERRYQKVLDYNARLAQVYGPYLFEKGSSRSGKNDTQELLAAMSEEEKQSFGFDMEKLDWKGFFPEMEMVARGLEKLLKVEQREFLMNMLVGVCSEESHRSAAEALGLIETRSMEISFLSISSLHRDETNGNLVPIDHRWSRDLHRPHLHGDQPCFNRIEDVQKGKKLWLENVYEYSKAIGVLFYFIFIIINYCLCGIDLTHHLSLIYSKNVQKPSYNQLFGYSSAPNMKYASMFGCRASAATASDDGENSSLSSSVLMPKQKTKESILINENGSTNTGIGIVEFL
ncbi:hypothetical protein ACOSQ3_006248 [Xanthoceras sorbifolium]